MKKFDKLNILILGGNGFIGSHLVEVFKDDHDVTVFDRSPNKFLGELDGVKYIYGDFENILLIEKVLQDKDVVYHLLSSTVPITANNDPVFDINSNLIGTVNLLKTVARSGVKRLIYTSSGGTVYGNPQYLPIDEMHPCNPIGSYGIVKRTVEEYIKMYARNNRFSYVIARPSNPYGPRQNFLGNQGLISKFLYTGLMKKKFVVWGDGSAIRDYIYITDLVEFLRIAGLQNISGTFNVGSGEGRSIKEIIKHLSEITYELPMIEYTNKNQFFVEEVVLDIKSVKEKFGWKPQVSIKEGLTLHNNWMKSLKLTN